MCISLEVSLVSYVLGIIMFMLVYKRNKYNDKWMAIFMIYILQMQLLEVIMWLDQKCEGYNQKASMIAYFFTIFQPLANYLTMLYILGINETTKRITFLMVPYFIASLFYMKENYPTEKELCTKPENDCWLEWKWMKKNMYWVIWLISLFIPFMALSDKSFNGLFPVSYIAISLIIAFNFSKDMKYISKPSLWCVLQALMPIAMLTMT